MLRTVPFAALAVLATSAAAMPNVHPRATTTTDSLSPWVTVADDGTRSTVTPVLTTIDGTATVISGAPNDLTATVFTQTNNGDMTTSTGTAPMATATDSDGAGSFLLCRNSDTLFCQPSDGSTLNPGTTYYFTWDTSASFFKGNTSIMIQGNYRNATTGEITSQAFTSEKMAASWGFWSLKIDKSLMQGYTTRNISVQMAILNSTTGNATSNSVIKSGPVIVISNPATYHQPQASLPSGAALYIGLPVIFAFVILCLVGTCMWNKKHRQINLGNVMSRTRHGRGFGKPPRVRRAFGGKERREKEAAQRVQLLQQEVAANGMQAYRDVPDRHDVPTLRVEVDTPRRDSAALDSLAGTPTSDRRMDFHRPGAGGDRNIFREELKRQDGEIRL